MLIKQITENCAKLNARRNLFGPVDHEKTDFWLRQRLTEMQQKSTEKWGFNFATGQPCHDENSNFQWSSIQTGCDSQPQSSGVASASVPSHPLDAIASGCDKEFSSSPLNRKSLSQSCQKTPTSRTTSVDKLGKRHSLRDSTGTTSRSKQARVTGKFQTECRRSTFFLHLTTPILKRSFPLPPKTLSSAPVLWTFLTSLNKGERSAQQFAQMFRGCLVSE